MSNMDDLLSLVRGKRAAIKATSGGFQNATKLPGGKSRWRILPGWNAAEPHKFFHDFAQHFIKDDKGAVKAVYVCESKTYERPCSICDTVKDHIRAVTDDGVLKILKEMDSRRVYLVNALRMDGSSADPKKPVLLQLPTSVLDSYLALLEERNGDGINILSLEEGRDIVINKEGAGLSTEYKLNDAPKNSAVHSEAMANVTDISAWIEAEFRRGVTKGTALVESTVGAVARLGMSPAAAAAGLTAPATGRLAITSTTVSSLVPSSRIIEAEELPLTATIDEDAIPFDRIETPAKTAAAAPKPAAGLMDQSELDDLLASLDS